MEYKYQDEEGKWLFAYDRSDGLGMAEGYYAQTDEYQNASIKKYSHPNGTQKAEEELINSLKGDGNALSWTGEKVTITDNLPTKTNAENGYAYALGMGEWGVCYRYTARLKNLTDKKIKVACQLKAKTDVIMAYREENSPFKMQTNMGRSVENGETYQTMFEIEIEPNSMKEYEFSVANLIGLSPCSQRMQIVEISNP